MSFSFDMQWLPVDDQMLRYSVDQAQKDPTYTFAYTLGDKTTLYKQCKFESSKARCTCGFRRYTKKGYFKSKQIEDMKDHMEIARTDQNSDNHTISITHDMIGQKK